MKASQIIEAEMEKYFKLIDGCGFGAETWDIAKYNLCKELLPKIKEIESKDYKYTVSMCPLLVNLLSKVYRHCIDNEKTEFLIHDIPMLRGEYTNFSKLQKFGLLYRIEDQDGKRVKGGLYGINKERVEKFFNNEWNVASEYKVDGDGNMIISEDRIYFNQIPMKGWNLEYGEYGEVKIPSFIKLKK